MIVMGVQGSGKSTIGTALAKKLNVPFVDGDSLHSSENIRLMASGHALTDQERLPWLHAVGERLAAAGDHGLVMACSALKEAYRRVLTPNDVPDGAVRFVYLDVPADVLRDRLEHRAHHYAPPELLESQLATLEPPRDAIRLDGTLPPDEIVRAARSALSV